LGGFADEVTAGEEVASRVGGERWWRSNLRRNGAASGGGGGDSGGVLCGEAATEMEDVWAFHLRLCLVGLLGQCWVLLLHHACLLPLPKFKLLQFAQEEYFKINEKKKNLEKKMQYFLYCCLY